jgi:TRAP-type C4-dicarboxylate transport system substrate-binding protein
MKIKRRSLGVNGAVATLALLLLLGSFTPVESAEPKPIEMKLAFQYPNVSTIGRGLEYFANKVSQQTGGRVKITTFPSATLLAPDKVYEGVVTGIAEMGNTTPAYTAKRFPANDATLLPLPIKSAWTLSMASQDWYDKFKPKEFKDTHLLFYVSCGPYVLASRDKPILKPEDLKGMKVRTAGLQAGAFVKALGGTPVSMPMSEVFEAASKGMIDVLLVPLETLKAYKHGDVTKYVTILPVSFANPTVTVMNLKKWNSLPKDIQEVFNKVCKNMADITGKAWWYGDIIGEEYFLSLGGDRKIIEIPHAEASEWSKLVRPLTEEYIREKKNLPAAEYVKYIEERTKYWNDRQPDKKVVAEFVEKEIMKGN